MSSPRSGPGFLFRFFAPLAPLLMLLLSLWASRRKENRSGKAWKCVLVFLLLAGGTAWIFFFLPADAWLFPERFSRPVLEKEKTPGPAPVVLGGAVAASQFSRGIVIHVFGDRTAGLALWNCQFPARIVVLRTKDLSMEGDYPERPVLLPDQTGEKFSSRIGNPREPDILFIVPGALKFPFDVFLSPRVLHALGEEIAQKRGVFAFLLSDLEGEKAKKAQEEACGRLSRIYANVYAVSWPRMVLASDTALNLDPETLESSWGEEFFPKGVLKIFLPDLKKSSLYRKKGDAGKEAFPMMPFSFLLHGENHQGISGMILKVFLVWAEFLNEYFWLFWALFLPGYFVFRYFLSPGEKRKKFFQFFENAFFLAGFPLGTILLQPEKWLDKELIVSFLLLPGLTASLAAWRSAGKRKKPSHAASFFRKVLSFLRSLLSALLPWLGLLLCLPGQELRAPCPAFFPFPFTFFRFFFAVLFLFGGAFCGSSLAGTAENLEKEELPRILLITLAGSSLAFLLILPVAFGGWTVMVPLFVFLSLLRICVLRKN
ncbi:MAG: hypothetical protein J6331_09815 [Lentisphaeria bacterium]|nr:hypothetical protein [Lentisphaeria bacterium]